MEKHDELIPYLDQEQLFDQYLECLHDHHKKFYALNKNDSVNYVVKNYKYSKEQHNMYAPKINKNTWDAMKKFCKTHCNSYITVAEDYETIPHAKWKSPKYHYLRGRDDFTCFYLSQSYKKQYVNAYIMSDDKFKDHDMFKQIPAFMMTVISKHSIHAEFVKPHSRPLGQLKDYKITKITTSFQFNKKPKYALPGYVWI